MRNTIIIFVISCLLVSCKAQNPLNLSQDTLRITSDSIAFNNSYVYLNEVALKNSDYRNNTILDNIQELSENKWIQPKRPEERLIEKIKKLKECLHEKNQDCEYVPEGYEIKSMSNGLVNLAYSYNQLGSYDNYFKYGCYDTQTAKRIVYTDIFKNPTNYLDTLNSKYVSELFMEPGDYAEEDQEYDIISHHLETREPFQLEHLNNFELVLEGGSFTAIRFHYNGLGGNYKSFVPNGYVEYAVKEIKSQLKQSFLRRIN